MTLGNKERPARKTKATTTVQQRTGGRIGMRASTSQESNSQTAYRLIRRDIILCALPPGTEITESELVERYGFGKSPIRWALASLRSEGLVDALPRRGYVISPLTIQDVNDVFDVRLILERAATKLAIERGEVDLKELRALSVRYAKGYTPGNRESQERFYKANREFHLAVARATGNRKLTTMLGQALDEMERLFHLGFSVRVPTELLKSEHDRLIKAIAKSDVRDADRLVVEQAEEGRQLILRAILSKSGLRQINIGEN